MEEGGRALLVDTPPELRLQLVAAEVERVDAVFLSHEHADHSHGIDDLRIFSLRSRSPLPLHVAREFVPELERRFSYIWSEASAPPESVIPELEIRAFEDGDRIDAAGLDLVAIAFPHGVYRSYGFRAGDLAVIVDGKRVTPRAEGALRGVRVLVINALWFGDPHPGHFSIEEAIDVSRRLKAEKTYLTHLAHRTSHAELEAGLPEGVEAAYDGLAIDV